MTDVGEFHVGHSKLFTLIDVGRTLHAKQRGGEQFCTLEPELLIVAETRYGSRLVVVVPVQAVPTFMLESDLPTVEDAFEFGQRPRVIVPFALRTITYRDMLELKHHVQFVTFWLGVEDGLFWTDPWRFADGQDVVLGKDLLV